MPIINFGRKEKTVMADLDKWSINETLLQSYRSIFISSQSFMLAVGAIISGKSIYVFMSIFFAGLVMIWFIWFPCVRARHRTVDYHKFGGTLDDSKLSELCSEKEYVHNAELRKKANILFGIETNWRPTRRKVDFLMPVIFSFIWFVLLVYEISQL